jgi:hypothetical protein
MRMLGKIYSETFFAYKLLVLKFLEFSKRFSRESPLHPLFWCRTKKRREKSPLKGYMLQNGIYLPPIGKIGNSSEKNEALNTINVLFV